MIWLPTTGVDRGTSLINFKGLINVAMGGGNEIEISNLSFTNKLE